MSEEYAPTQSGTISGYQPECCIDDVWKKIEIHPKEGGIPADKFSGGVLNTIGLCSYEQANALAWIFAADYAARGKPITVRSKRYEVSYEIKAKEVTDSE